MFPLLLALFVISVVVLAAGAILLLTGRGKVSRQTGREAGAAVMGAIMEDEPEPDQVTVADVEKSVFIGTGARVQVEAEGSFTEVKAALRDRRWGDALPGLLIGLGMAGLLIFGSLALMTQIEERIIGIAIVVVAVYAAARIGWDFIKA
jgi:hypothetical protein